MDLRSKRYIKGFYGIFDSNMYLVALLLAASVVGNELWKDDCEMNPWYPGSCKEGRGASKGAPGEVGKRKVDDNFDMLEENENQNENPTYGVIHSSYIKETAYCSCDREGQLVDLGPNFFPRYYVDMSCAKSAHCGLYSCKPRHYKLWVMRRRGATEPHGEAPVPVELRKDWIGERITVTTDCECRP